MTDSEFAHFLLGYWLATALAVLVFAWNYWPRREK